ncbi:aluminum-activated malate transporter 14-like [Nymphaea colorata]|nr:aluminum-activated malate transporter 14-like [Nymphaea colorata]
MEKSDSRVVAIEITDDIVKKKESPCSQFHHYFLKQLGQLAGDDPRKLLHCVKVGCALLLVSLLYLIEPLYEQVGDNAMWAIMTVVVMFEYTAGATLSKGLNRASGTILGGVLGLLVGILAQKFDRKASAACISVFVFVIGATATRFRFVPTIKRKYDYGIVVFLLTYNLVAVSGHREEQIVRLASDRLAMIAFGFTVTIMISLIIFPVSAGDELHKSLVSKFKNIKGSLEECIDEIFKDFDGKEKPLTRSTSKSYISVMHSKSADELMANFAKWEPWHGRIGKSYPWNKYMQIGDILRQLAASIHTLYSCLESQRQPSDIMKITFKYSCKELASEISGTLGELAESIEKTKKCRSHELINGQLSAAAMAINAGIAEYKWTMLKNEGDNRSILENDMLPISCLAFVLLEIGEKVQELAKKVEELGDLASFYGS